MKYKGIDILPYSAIVRYYNANIVELRRNTRQYSTERDSWNVAFDFVVESANMAKNNPKKFINEWIVNEISEMVSGLKNISERPHVEINRLIERKQNKVENGFGYSVRNISNDEIEDYKVYTNEMNIAFKAEKVTGALSFLEKLSELAELLPTIYKSMDEIKLLNKTLIPELEESIPKIQDELDKESKQLEKLEPKLGILNEKIEPHKNAIRELQEPCRSWREKDQVEKDYESEHPEYGELCSEKKELLTSIDALKTHIRKRTNFINCLKACQNRIQTHLLAV